MHLATVLRLCVVSSILALGACSSGSRSGGASLTAPPPGSAAPPIGTTPTGTTPTTPIAPYSGPTVGPSQLVMHQQVLPVTTLQKPAKGAPFQDPAFGLTVTRMTDAQADLSRQILQTNYACFDHLNCDGTFAVAQSNGQMFLIETSTYTCVKRLGFSGDASPRWDFADPNILYYSGNWRGGMGFHRYDVTNDQDTLIRDFSADFPTARRLFMPSYAGPSVDGRYWGFLILRGDHDEHGTPAADTNVMAAIVYDKTTDAILGQTTARLGRNISMSMSGARVVMADNKGFFGTYSQDRQRALAREYVSYELDFSDPIPLGTGQGHSDLAVDAYGRDVKVFDDAHTGYIVMQDIETAVMTPLLRSAGGGLHVSANCAVTPGWALVSTYGGDGRTVSSWQEESLFLLELVATPRVIRLAHTRAAYGGYTDSPKAAIDRLGRAVFWGSNWCNAGGSIDLYRVEIPKGWYEQVMGVAGAQSARQAFRSRLDPAAAAQYDMWVAYITP